MNFSRLGACALALFCLCTATSADEAKETLKAEPQKFVTGLGDRYALSACCDSHSHKIFVFGGEKNGKGGFEFQNDMMVLDTGAKKPAWQKLNAGSTPSKRAYSPFGVNNKQRKAYIFGGFLDGGAFANDFWSFDMKGAKWEQLHAANVKGAPPGRDAHAVVADEETSMVYVFGGLKGISPMEAYNDLWCYNMKSRNWSEIKPKGDAEWPVNRYFHSMCAIGGGKALLYGGNTGDVNPKGTAAHYFYELDLKAGTWKKLTQPGELRCYQDAVWHPTLKKLLVLNGGYSAANDDIFAYDPAKDTWEKIGNSGHAHTYGASVVDSQSGDLYTFGGLAEMNFLGKHAVDETWKVKLSAAK